MKRQTAALFIASLCAVAPLVIAGDFRSVMIKPKSDSLTLDVPDVQFLAIRSFTQEGGSQRGVVTVTANGETNNVWRLLSLTWVVRSAGVYKEGSDSWPSRNNGGARARSNAFRNLQTRARAGKSNADAHPHSHRDPHSDTDSDTLIRQVVRDAGFEPATSCV